MARLHYYYHRLLQFTLSLSKGTLHRSVRYSTRAWQFTHSLSKNFILSLSKGLVILLVIAANILVHPQVHAQRVGFHGADDPAILYTGRVDFTNSRLPRFWQPGVYITIKFIGESCSVILNDEVLWGKNQNYLEIVVDGNAKRIQTKGRRDTIEIDADRLAGDEHTLVICKNTEANIGYLEFVGIWCQQLVEPSARPKRKIEFIGNSITCGTGADQSEIPCGKGVWQDQHNAYLSYGPVTARALNAQYHLSAVSGIGLMRSCCNIFERRPSLQ